MFVFLFILLTTNVIFALPLTKKDLSYLEKTTIIPQDNNEKSTNHVHESINTLQSVINIIFPNERNFSLDRQSLLIGCLIKKIQTTGERQRTCKGIHENNEKNIFYEFEDKPLEENNTDDLSIHVEHINVARIENNKQNSNESKKNFIDTKKMNFSSIQNLFHLSKSVDTNHDNKNDNRGGMFLWSSNNDSIETVKQNPQYYSTHERTEDDYDSNRISPRLNRKSSCTNIFLKLDSTAYFYSRNTSLQSEKTIITSK